MNQEKLDEILENRFLPDGSFRSADFSGDDLSWLDFSGKNASNANFSSANLSNANLAYATLAFADFTGAKLDGANLKGASLFCANLNGASLSGVKGLISPIDFIESHFEKTSDGYIAYKVFNYIYTPPTYWKIKRGSIIEEVVNFDRCADSGCGINVSSLYWMQRNRRIGHIWKVLIRWEWLAGVCVPYNSDGRIRCERVELLETISVSELLSSVAK